MKAFDTDILTEILAGNPAYAERLASVPVAEQAIPIVVCEEIIRGRLNVIRQAESGKARILMEQAYDLFEQTLADLREREGAFIYAAGRRAFEGLAQKENPGFHARSANCRELRSAFGHTGHAQSPRL